MAPVTSTKKKQKPSKLSTKANGVKRRAAGKVQGPASDSKTEKADPLSFLEKYSSVDSPSDSLASRSRWNRWNNLSVMSQVSENTPLISRGMLTPTEQDNLIKAYNDLLGLKMEPRIMCPAYKCSEILNIADANSMYRHFDKKHRPFRCLWCHNPPVECGSQEQLDEHVLKAHTHVFDQDDLDGRTQVVGAKGKPLDLGKLARVKNTQARLGFFYWETEQGEKIPESFVVGSSILENFEKERKRLPSAGVFCSRCFRKFPPRKGDQPDRDLQMLAHTDSVRSCRIQNQMAPLDTDDSYLPNRLGWYTHTQFLEAAFETIKFCREQSGRELPSLLKSFNEQLFDKMAAGASPQSPQALSKQLQNLARELNFWAREKDCPKDYERSFFSLYGEKLDDDYQAHDPNMTSSSFEWGVKWTPWYKRTGLPDEEDEEELTQNDRTALGAYVHDAEPPADEVNARLIRARAAWRQRRKEQAAAEQQPRKKAAANRTTSKAVSLATKDRDMVMELSSEEDEEEDIASRSSDVSPEPSNPSEEQGSSSIASESLQETPLDGFAPHLREASSSQRAEVYGFGPAEDSDAYSSEVSDEDSSRSSGEKSSQSSGKKSSQNSEEDSSQGSKESLAAENGKTISVPKGKKRAKGAKTPQDRSYSYASDNDLDDDLVADVDDLTPAKRRKIDDPTFKPSTVDRQIEAEDRAEELADSAVKEKKTQVKVKKVAIRSPAASFNESKTRNNPPSKTREPKKSAVASKTPSKTVATKTAAAKSAVSQSAAPKSSTSKPSTPNPAASKTTVFKPTIPKIAPPKTTAPKTAPSKKPTPKKIVPQTESPKKVTAKKVAPKKSAPKKTEAAAPPARRVTRAAAKSKGTTA